MPRESAGTATTTSVLDVSYRLAAPAAANSASSSPRIASTSQLDVDRASTLARDERRGSGAASSNDHAGPSKSATRNTGSSRRGNPKSRTTAESNHQPRGRQNQQQQQPKPPPALGTDGPVTLMKRSSTQDDRRVNPENAGPVRQQSLPVASGPTGEDVAPSRPAGIIQLPLDARPTPPDGQSAQRHPKTSAPPRGHQQQHHHNHPHQRVNEVRRDGPSNSSRSRFEQSGPSALSSTRRNRNNIPNDNEEFDRGRDRSADAHNAQHQLFDPRKHNALSFSRDIASSAGTASVSDTRTNSLAGSTAPTSAPSIASSEGRDRRKRRGPGAAGAASESSASSRARNGKGPRSAEAAAADGHPSAPRSKASEANGYVRQLRKVYQEMESLEAKLKHEHQHAADREATSSLRMGRLSDGSIDHEFWLRLTQMHKKLADLHNLLLELALRPELPTSHQSTAHEYCLPSRLWQTAFRLHLERLRFSLPYPAGKPIDGRVTESEEQAQSAMMDHLTDFIYYAYGFYSSLLENDAFRTFRSAWLENLGDVARYRMVVAGLNATFENGMGGGIRNKAARDIISHENSRSSSPSVGEPSAAAAAAAVAVDDALASQTGVKQAERASIGSAALGDWELEDRPIWSNTAKGWYAKGLAQMPGTGRLHYHLATLSQKDDLRALHHFCKSLTSTQPYDAARESMLDLFAPEEQTRRIQPDASLEDLFVHLHGMLFTRVQLDDFDALSVRFLHKLQSTVDGDPGWESGAGSISLMMMGSVNIAAVMQYGSEGIVMQNTTPGTKAEEVSSDGGGTDVPPPTTTEDLPISLQNSIQLAFAALAILLPQRSASGHLRTIANPYVTLMMTFLFRLARSSSNVESSTAMPQPLAILEHAVPWTLLAALPALRTDMQRLHNAQKISSAKPLAEDWCLRGLTWPGSKLFERGYFKAPDATGTGGSGQRLNSSDGGGGDAGGWTTTATSTSAVVESEVDVLDASAGDDDVEHDDSIEKLRWERIGLALNALVDVVPGFIATSSDNSEGVRLGQIIVAPPLSTSIEHRAMQEQISNIDKATSQLNVSQLNGGSAVRLSDEEDVGDGDQDGEGDGDDLEDLEDDSEQLRNLKARIRELRAALNQQKTTVTVASSAPSNNGRGKQRPTAARSAFVAVPGYTTLVLDTNVILTGKATFLQTLVESHLWTVIIPLAVVTELEGLRHSAPPLGHDATWALSYLETAVKSHQTWLKVQTSKGNYLCDLSFRHEDLDLDVLAPQDDGSGGTDAMLGGSGSAAAPTTTKSAKARTLDEVILRCFLWQRDHWTDRRNIVLHGARGAKSTAVVSTYNPNDATPKVIMVTLDRGLRLRVRTKGMPAAGKKELADILTTTEAAAKAAAKT